MSQFKLSKGHIQLAFEVLRDEDLMEGDGATPSLEGKRKKCQEPCPVGTSVVVRPRCPDTKAKPLGRRRGVVEENGVGPETGSHPSSDVC